MDGRGTQLQGVQRPKVQEIDEKHKAGLQTTITQRLLCRLYTIPHDHDTYWLMAGAATHGAHNYRPCTHLYSQEERSIVCANTLPKSADLYTVAYSRGEWGIRTSHSSKIRSSRFVQKHHKILKKGVSHICQSLNGVALNFSGLHPQTPPTTTILDTPLRRTIAGIEPTTISSWAVHIHHYPIGAAQFFA